MAHTLGEFNSCNLNSDPCFKLVLKGADNIAGMNQIQSKPDRLPMNVHLLKILCNRIANLEWSDFSKQVVWTACTVCFYTLCRMGKLLAPNEKTFDAATSLKWENVKFIAEK